jgi:hypothetical protein
MFLSNVFTEAFQKREILGIIQPVQTGLYDELYNNWRRLPEKSIEDRGP